MGYLAISTVKKKCSTKRVTDDTPDILLIEREDENEYHQAID